MAENHTPNGSGSKIEASAEKPYPDFPLSIHGPTGRFYKKIKGKRYYFGYVKNGWRAALDLYELRRDDLYMGRKPRVSKDVVTLMDVSNRFLTAKKRQLEAGELEARSFYDYHRTCRIMLEYFGKTRAASDLGPEDFSAYRAHLAKTLGHGGLANQVARARTVLNWAAESRIIERPFYGPDFKKPGKKTMRLDRASKPAKVFTAAEIRRLIDGAPNAQMKAAVLLGINCAVGARDICLMPLSVLDLDGGWMDYTRRKTGEARRCPLWPETVAALRQVLANRPIPKKEADADLVFLTPRGHQCLRGKDGVGADYIGEGFRHLIRDLGLEREGRGFYGLRHTFRTIADSVGDDKSINTIMGHNDDASDKRAINTIMGSTDDRMAAFYLHGIEATRLRKVSDLVHGWLFPAKQETTFEAAEVQVQ